MLAPLALAGSGRPEQVQANFENGVVTVTVPKTEQQDRIQIGGSREREGAKSNAESGPGAKSSHAHRPKSVRAGERVDAGAVTPLGRHQFAQPRNACDRKPRFASYS